jgi:hypothetical protein
MLGWQLPADEVPGRFSTKNIDMSELSEIKRRPFSDEPSFCLQTILAQNFAPVYGY